MHKAEILPKAIRRFRVTTDSRKTKASPNLINRDFTSEHPNDLWLSDITYSTPSQRGPPGWGLSCLSMSGMHRSSELMVQ